MRVGKLLGLLGLAMLLCGTVSGGLAGAAVSMASEFQARSDPAFAGWSSGTSWPGAAVVHAVTGALVGAGAALVSFLGAAIGLLVQDTVRPGRSRRSPASAAGMGAGIFTAAAAALVLPGGGSALALLFIGIGLSLLSGITTALLAGYAGRYLKRRTSDGY
ncbi:hypothetical protein LJ756_01285 [Arthrobacter sp. zg-Y411]|uniref:hypothetical protein n=1 Tax=Arthrobacter zhangbolii TaxID=2886936 RepID=UPI001D145085|nr:hypothetical protein [Arthrobacter zhangbolii]MCC3293249.1 hypothetical protein [Arthrobacter zhangbolii]